MEVRVIYVHLHLDLALQKWKYLQDNGTYYTTWYNT